MIIFRCLHFAVLYGRILEKKSPQILEKLKLEAVKSNKLVLLKGYLGPQFFVLNEAVIVQKYSPDVDLYASHKLSRYDAE